MADRVTTLVRGRVRLHPHTVQRAARGAVRAPQRRRASSAREETPTTQIVVQASVWRVARRLAGGDPLRIEVVSPTSVVVHNHRHWR